MSKTSFEELDRKMIVLLHAELIMLAMIFLTTGFEYVKQVFLPNIQIWQSQFYSIVFCSLVAGIAGYFALSGWQELSRKTAGENAGRRMELISNIFHEMHDPLTSIKGFSSTMREEKGISEGEREEYLGIIEEESDHLTRLVEQLMDMARIEAGTLKMKPELFQLPDVIHKKMESVHERAAKKDIVIEEEIPADLPLVYADKERTADVILNLLNNAVRHNRKGGRVSVQARDEGRNVRIEVNNAGMGPVPEGMAQIFERFYRVDQVEERTIETGLELSLAKNLAEAQGGSMSIEENDDMEKKFVLTLPKGANN